MPIDPPNTDDQVAAEQWMANNAYDRATVGTPTGPQTFMLPKDDYSIKRWLRAAYAAGLAAGRTIGLTRPHFTIDEVQRMTQALLGDRWPLSSQKRDATRGLLRSVYPHATFEEEEPTP